MPVPKDKNSFPKPFWSVSMHNVPWKLLGTVPAALGIAQNALSRANCLERLNYLKSQIYSKLVQSRKSRRVKNLAVYNILLQGLFDSILFL